MCKRLTSHTARNVLLFTLIVDRCPTLRIWNIFYHFKIDGASLSLLVEQCEKLISVSGNPNAWSTSKYSTFLHFCTHRTLVQLRHHWELYMQAAKFSRAKNEAILAMFDREYQNCHKKDIMIISTSRSAGPFILDATEIQKAHFTHYWRTGTVFVDAKDVASATVLNPTFIYSLKGEGCSLHYGSYPLQGFHLLAAFAPKNRPGKSVTISDLFASAQSQFQQWGDALNVALESNSHRRVTIRLFVGDALAFCHTLRHCHLTSSTSAARFVSTFTAAELVLDGGDYGPNALQPAPTAFNVIDTSNVTDHVGLLNVLITTVSLLIQSPSTTLYTESLLTPSDGDILKSFPKLLCSDIQTTSLLFGVAPVGYLSGFNSHSNLHEIVMSRLLSENSKQYQERLAWKIPHLGDAIGQHLVGEEMLYPTFDPFDLAKLLISIYHKMFQHENMMRIFQLPGSLLNSLLHYDRGTFVALLSLVKSRVHTNWDVVMDHIFDMMHTDQKTILGTNFYQDFCCQLFVRGVYTVDIYKKPPTSDFMRTMLFRDWARVPPLVCVLLVIPKEKLAVLNRPNVGTPILQCDVRSETFHNIFSEIQIVYGSLTVKGAGSDARAIVTEDPKGFAGSSDLVLSVWVPAICFTISDPQKTQIGLGVHSTPATALAFGDTLGLTMTVFAANLLDRKRVHVLAESPHFSRKAGIPTIASPTMTHEQVSVGFCDLTISTLTAKWDFDDNVSAIGQVQTQQVSPCVMKVTMGNATKLLYYPFPINGNESKLRVARKSRWIEVGAHLLDPYLMLTLRPRRSSCHYLGIASQVASRSKTSRCFLVQTGALRRGIYIDWT